MLEFTWLRMWNFEVKKDGEAIATIFPSTPEKSSISFEESFNGNREKESKRIINAFFTKKVQRFHKHSFPPKIG